MDSSSVTRYSTDKNMFWNMQIANEGEDIISNIPESIIGRILSFLPIKDAVRTSVLSKKWIYLWTFITDLHFDDRLLYSSNSKTEDKYFVNFVYRVLLHLSNLSIQSFSLVISKKYDPPVVSAWISAVLNRRVQKLCIDSNEELALSFHSLSNCKSLVELVLKMDRCAFRFPTFVCFGNLEFLNLSGIIFTSDSSSNSKELILSFPVLKKFEAKNCTWLECVTLKAPLLESVLIEVEDSLELQSCESHNCAIKFCAYRLTEFAFRGHISQDIILLYPSSAHNASANIIFSKLKNERLQETGLRACMLLKQVNQVGYLKLEGNEVLAQADCYFSDLPAFAVLSHLELNLVFGEILLGLLLKSPFLKTLVLKGIYEFDEELLNSAIVPDCFLSTLQVVKFKAFTGRRHQYCLAKFVLENAVVLKRMTFSVFSVMNKSNGHKFTDMVKKKILSYRKGCSFATLGFSTIRSCSNL